MPDANPLLCLIDTGFNGEMWLTRADAITFGVDFDAIYIETGHAVGMRPIETGRGFLRIIWLGHERIVNVVVDLDSSHRTVQASEPAALIGTELLDPATLTINFEKRRCVVRSA